MSCRISQLSLEYPCAFVVVAPSMVIKIYGRFTLRIFGDVVIFLLISKRRKINVRYSDMNLSPFGPTMHAQESPWCVVGFIAYLEVDGFLLPISFEVRVTSIQFCDF